MPRSSKRHRIQRHRRRRLKRLATTRSRPMRKEKNRVRHQRTKGCAGAAAAEANSWRDAQLSRGERRRPPAASHAEGGL